jgi:membrane fusion protein, copper/silver efflux system
MKKLLIAILFLAILSGAFWAGSWYRDREPGKGNPSGIKSIATNPDKGSDVDTDISSLPLGAVRIIPEKQQLIGVRTGQVEKSPQHYTIRTLGRVAVDETKIYRINSAVDGWIRKTYENSTGTLVKKDELLASFYSPEFLSAQQAYIFALSSADRFQASGREKPEQITLTRSNVQQYRDTLRNLGMGDLQIEELGRTRLYTENINITSPITGFVLTRNVSSGERFEKGKEFYRMADLSRVWILADVFESEAYNLAPGTKVRVSLPNKKKTFHAAVSHVLPQFDGTSRTLKVRLEADNPGYFLRPDMFVDVEIPVQLPEAITVSADAILDSGIRKTVFVDRGNGFFEPRTVETGWRMGNRVEIVRGLKPGERIVISGNFLIDSESKLEMAASGMQPTLEIDPVCGMEISPRKAGKEGLKSTYRGESYYFCSQACREQFEKDPNRFIKKTPAETSVEKVPHSKPPQKTEGHDHS